MELKRRNFIGLGLASAAGMCLGGAPAAVGGKGARSRSWYNGVEVGCITYSYRSMKQKNAEDIVKYAVEDGLGTLELKGEVVDEYLKRGGKRDMTRLPALRKLFEDAGVSIHIVKYGGIGGKNAQEDEYRIAAAKALGAACITREIPKASEYETIGRRCAELADKHGIYIAFHNHTQIDALTYDGPLLGYSPLLRINFDIGHYVAAMTDDAKRFIDPLAFVEKYHDKIFSLHLKDRTTKAHKSQNLEFGKGDTPIAKLFPFLQRKGWHFYCDIELEYKIPKGSNAVKEVARCNGYCRAVAGC
ncbi:MAG: TIM barrel protein [Kiritimatiellae bacterium]|nr:TIM barrel protein [Kiritimatiellia bacterium]